MAKKKCDSTNKNHRNGDENRVNSAGHPENIDDSIFSA